MAKFKLGEIAHECRTTWSGSRTDVPIVGLEHLIPGEIKLTNWDKNTENTFNKKFSKGQVLLGRRRVYLRKAVEAPCDGICSGDITVIETCRDIVLPELLPFIIQNDKFFDFAMQGSAGSLSPRVKWEHLANYEVDLPSIDEQRTLVKKLLAANKLKESYKRLLIATDEMVKSQFIEMFKDVSDIFPLSDLLSDNFPGEWGKEPTNSGGIKVIRTTNFTNEGRLDLSDVVTRDIDQRKIDKKRLHKGDIILERSGGTKDNPVGRVVYFDEDGSYLFNNFTQLLRVKDGVNSVYLFYCLYCSYNLNKASMRAMASQTTGIQNLNMSSYLSNQIKLPAKANQDAFERIYRQADKSKFVGFKSQFIEMFGCESNAFKGDKTYAFDDICYDDTKCAVKVPASEYQKDGKFPIFDQSQDTYIAGYTSNEDSPCEDVPVILFGDHSRVFKYINQPFYIGADGVKLIRAKKPNINTAFMYYSLLYKNIPNTGYNRHFKWVKLQKFVLPPMVLQEEFVSIARQADKSKFELRKSIEAIDKVIKSLINN
jgi:type I restriction enzyme S subunit